MTKDSLSCSSELLRGNIGGTLARFVGAPACTRVLRSYSCVKLDAQQNVAELQY